MTNAILIVDDNADLCRTVRRLLRHMGYSAECAFSGPEALCHIRQHKPGLVLLDYMMPEMNGLEVLNKVKADAATSEIPVVMLTAVSDPNTAKSAMNEGASAYWVKGLIDYDRLRLEVGKFVNAAPAV